MKVLVIGGGGREHALCWKLAQSQRVHKIYCAPGNPGTATVAENLAIEAHDTQALLLFAEQHKVDLTVVGPELPLIAGIVDAFEARGLRIFGPSAEPARLEGSKAYAKNLMARAGIPTAAFEVFTDADKAREYVQTTGVPIVIKADGAAAGKGVVVAQTMDEANEAIAAMMERKIFGAAGETVVIEEAMRGEEISVMAFVDGDTVKPMLAVQDHKRALDGDRGANTGGMGAYAPVPVATNEVMQTVLRTIIVPAVEAIKQTGIPYRGVLYAGVMLTTRGAMCLEFNCRFGDPETQVILPLLQSDLADILCAVADVELEKTPVVFAPRAAVCVVLASGGYPGAYEPGKAIHGLESAAGMDAVAVFHAGTAQDDAGKTVTNGGRVLGVTATGDTFSEARARVYAAVRKVGFDGAFYRSDIGARAEANAE
ncbi:MAG: phosphoribosylamine--glycine ligase [Armatimonadetes bacterium]|nr:phosphoribosylamine--glycine ligase [Armatimonadota bacterium]